MAISLTTNTSYYQLQEDKQTGKIYLKCFTRVLRQWNELDFLSMEYFKISNKIYKITKEKQKNERNIQQYGY